MTNNPRVSIRNNLCTAEDKASLYRCQDDPVAILVAEFFSTVTVKQGLDDWEKLGRDRLFHGAPAVIIVGSKPGGSCPMEVGLGTCLIGYAVSVLAEDRTITRNIGIPDEESVHTVIALGYPDENYQTLIGRKKVVPRYFEC
jgi:hypothetical protein